MAYIPPPLTFDFGLDNLDSIPLEGCAAACYARTTPVARRPRRCSHLSESAANTEPPPPSCARSVQPATPGAKGDAKRLARCGKCDNCTRQVRSETPR